MMQLEFPFTRRGAQQHYTAQQIEHMDSLYREFVRNSDLQHTESLYNNWCEVYVLQNAIEYKGEYHQPFSPLVEYNNDRVIERWHNNKLFYKSIEDFIW